MTLNLKDWSLPLNIIENEANIKVNEMITHCCLTRPIRLPGGASTVTSIAQQSQPAQQCHPAQHLKSLVTRITS